MHQDEIIMYASIAILVILIMIAIRVDKRFGVTNASIFITYSLLQLYGLYFEGQDGISLVWWFYLLLITWVHTVIVVIYLVIRFMKRKLYLD